MWLLFGLIGAVICGAIASAKGRSVIAWSVLGFLFPLLFIIIIACLSNQKEQKNYRQRVELENIRLREQMRQERMKSEAFRQYSLQRLDAHDNALGVDTRSQPSLLTSGSEEFLSLANDASPSSSQSSAEALAALAGQDANPAAPAASSASSRRPIPAVPAGGDGPKWYYHHQGKAMGPLPAQNIREMLMIGTIPAATPVWSKGMPGWQPASTVETFNVVAQ